MLLLDETSDDVTDIPLAPSNKDPGTLISPGPIFEDNKVTLTWDHSDGATYYDLGVRDLGTNEFVVDQHVQNNSLTVTLEFGRSYRWNLSACNDAGCSDFTDPLYFRIAHLESDQTILLDVPYLHQMYHTLDEFNGGWACGATSAIMILAYYNLIDPDPRWVNDTYTRNEGGRWSDYGKYVSEIYTAYTGQTWDIELDLTGYPHYKERMAGHGAWGFIHRHHPDFPDLDGAAKGDYVKEFFEGHGLQSTINEATEARVKNELNQGYPVMASVNTHGFGHMIVIIGYDPDSDLYIINDPLGDPTSDSYLPYGSPESGHSVWISWEGMQAEGRWIATARD